MGRVARLLDARRTGQAVAVLLLLALYATLALTAVRRKSATFDEASHLTVGYTYWRVGEHHFYPENGLAQQWAALALLPGRWAFPDLTDPAWSAVSNTHLADTFLYESGNDADALLFRGRAMASVLALALGLLVFAWARQLFGALGALGGLTALVLFVTCPAMLAHGPLVTADLAASLFFTAALWALWRVLHRVTAGTVLASCLALSGLFLSKMSAVIFVPAAVVLALVRLALGRPLVLAWRGREAVVRDRPRQSVVLAQLVVVHAAAVWAAVWAFCGFRYDAVRATAAPEGSLYDVLWPEVLAKPGWVTDAVRFAREHRLVPEAYLYTAACTNAWRGKRNSFLNGEQSLTGRWSFFPYCFLVKTSPALLALLAVAATGAVARLCAGDREVRRILYDATPLLVFLASYWAFALTSSLNIGHRHLLPIYPALYVLAGGAVYGLRPAGVGAATRSRVPGWSAAVLGLCLGFALFEALWTWPHYLAYFNFLAGGPRNGYKHLVDSSLDWGQDLKELAGWLRRRQVRGPAERVYLAYFGTAPPPYYHIDAVPLPSFFSRPLARKPLEGGTYCISATMLQGVYARYDAFRGRWGREQEESYQVVLTAMQRIEQGGGDPARVGKVLKAFGLRERDEFLGLYEEARFARLCAALRRREPDDQVGYSILLYHLRDADVRDALLGPAPYEPRPGRP